MLIEILGEDKDVVEINRDLPFSNQVFEDVVHHPLEGGRRICEPEEHDRGFEKSKLRFESSFPLVSCSNSNVVVTFEDV